MFTIGSRKKSNDYVLNESIGFVANKIISCHNEKNIIVAFTSSLNRDDIDLIISQIINKVSQKLQTYVEETVLCEDDFTGDSPLKIKDSLNSLKEKNKITLLKVKPVNVYASALEVLKACDMIISVESYGRSKYADFEEMLYCLKNNSLNIDAVIGCRN